MVSVPLDSQGRTVRYIDSTVVGRRERELRYGMNEMLRGDLISKLPFVPGKGALQVRDAHTALIGGTFFWKDMNWIRDHWKGPIVIKGVLMAEDARRCLDHGAAAIVVSNDSAQQLDVVAATLRVLPEIALQ